MRPSSARGTARPFLFPSPFLPSGRTPTRERVGASYSIAHTCLRRRSRWTFKKEERTSTRDHTTTTTDHPCHHLARLFCSLPTHIHTHRRGGALALFCFVLRFRSTPPRDNGGRDSANNPQAPSSPPPPPSHSPVHSHPAVRAQSSELRARRWPRPAWGERRGPARPSTPWWPPPSPRTSPRAGR